MELAEYLGRITGGRFEVRSGDGGRGIVLGTLDEFPQSDLCKIRIRNTYDGREAYAIRTLPNRLLLIGATETGVSHAAFRLLEALGCRWFFPAREWEVVPFRPTLSIHLDETDRPAILRGGSGGGTVSSTVGVAWKTIRRGPAIIAWIPPSPWPAGTLGRRSSPPIRRRLTPIRSTWPSWAASGKGRSSASAVPRCGSWPSGTLWISSSGSRAATWFLWKLRRQRALRVPGLPAVGEHFRPRFRAGERSRPGRRPRASRQNGRFVRLQ